MDGSLEFCTGFVVSHGGWNGVGRRKGRQREDEGRRKRLMGSGLFLHLPKRGRLEMNVILERAKADWKIMREWFPVKEGRRRRMKSKIGRAAARTVLKTGERVDRTRMEVENAMKMAVTVAVGTVGIAANEIFLAGGKLRQRLQLRAGSSSTNPDERFALVSLKAAVETILGRIEVEESQMEELKFSHEEVETTRVDSSHFAYSNSATDSDANNLMRSWIAAKRGLNRSASRITDAIGAVTKQVAASIPVMRHGRLLSQASADHLLQRQVGSEELIAGTGGRGDSFLSGLAESFQNIMESVSTTASDALTSALEAPYQLPGAVEQNVPFLSTSTKAVVVAMRNRINSVQDAGDHPHKSRPVLMHSFDWQVIKIVADAQPRQSIAKAESILAAQKHAYRLEMRLSRAAADTAFRVQRKVNLMSATARVTSSTFGTSLNKTILADNIANLSERTGSFFHISSDGPF